MPERQAVVTLCPLVFDVLPFRCLTFDSDSDSINIGRSSKREAKNLTPADNNAWFESRVMSRNHASLRVSLEDKVVYIRDNASMHGTWVNDKKIKPVRDVAITANDVLTFGTEVTRGSETFPPLRARFEFQWFDSCEERAPSKSSSSRPPNSFCVPEDDDAVDVVYETVSPKDANFMVYNVDDSDMASDAENQPPAESTPLTSPSNEGKAAEESESANGPKGSQSSRSSPEVVNGSQKSPIIIDVEVPPVASDIAPSDAPANPEKSNITYPDPFGSLEDPYNEKGSVSERLSVDAGDDDDGDDVDIRDWDEYDKSDSEEDSSSQLSAEASDLGSGARELIYAALSYKPPYVESGDLEDVGIPSKLMRESDSDCPSLAVEKPEASMLGKTTSNVHSGFQPEIPEQASSRQFPGLYWTSPKPNTHLAPHSNSNERCCDPGFPPTTSVSSYSPMGTNQVNHPQPSYAPGDSCTTGYYTHAVPQLPLREDAEKSKPLGESPSVQVSDVVEQSSGVKQPSQQPLKRKAHEMESDSFQSELAEIESYLGQSAGVNTSMGRDSDNEESFSQDAQPRTSDSGAKCSASQLRELPPIDAHSSGQEPPRKRVNTGQRSRMGGLAAHATTALVGAMLGGLGTIVALASLPPEYFQ